MPGPTISTSRLENNLMYLDDYLDSKYSFYYLVRNLDTEFNVTPHL